MSGDIRLFIINNSWGILKSNVMEGRAISEGKFNIVSDRMICNGGPERTKGSLLSLGDGPTGLLLSLWWCRVQPSKYSAFVVNESFNWHPQPACPSQRCTIYHQLYVSKSGCESLLWSDRVSNIPLKQTCSGNKVFVWHIKYASVSALRIPVVIRVLKAFCGCGLIRLN